jgi:hypothetical protein
MTPTMNMNPTSDLRPEEAPNCMQNQNTHAKRSGEGGFALILAILALMLLTFLGLTLAATTSTELQIATNYRWSQQALYNAQAGLEVGKLTLMSADWTTILPSPRGAAPFSSPTAPQSRADQFGNASRNFEAQSCDAAVGNEGYGVVLDTGLGDAAAPYQNVTSFRGQTLNGAFTLWVRRPIINDAAGVRMDDTDNGNLIMTSEGTAPYIPGTGGALAFSQANRAVRILEIRLTNTPLAECPRPDQEGLNASGSGFNTCNPLDPGKDPRPFSSAR